jgi:hypothetical protein
MKFQQKHHSVVSHGILLYLGICKYVYKTCFPSLNFLFCNRAHPPMLAAGSEDGGRVILLEYSEAARRWTRVEPTGAWPVANDPVHDIAFAPNLGRSYHLLAIATNHVRIVSLKPLPLVNFVMPSYIV